MEALVQVMLYRLRISGGKTPRAGEHAPLDSDKGLKRFVLQKIDSKRI